MKATPMALGLIIVGMGVVTYAIRLSLILDKVREKYQITVDDADLEKEYAHLAKHHALPEKEIRKYYGEPKKAEELKDHLLHDKVSAFIREKIKVNEV